MLGELKQDRRTLESTALVSIRKKVPAERLSANHWKHVLPFLFGDSQAIDLSQGGPQTLRNLLSVSKQFNQLQRNPGFRGALNIYGFIKDQAIARVHEQLALLPQAGAGSGVGVVGDADLGSDDDLAVPAPQLTKLFGEISTAYAAMLVSNPHFWQGLSADQQHGLLGFMHQYRPAPMNLHVPAWHQSTSTSFHAHLNDGRHASRTWNSMFFSASFYAQFVPALMFLPGQSSKPNVMAAFAIAASSFLLNTFFVWSERSKAGKVKKRIHERVKLELALFNNISRVTGGQLSNLEGCCACFCRHYSALRRQSAQKYGALFSHANPPAPLAESSSLALLQNMPHLESDFVKEFLLAKFLHGVDLPAIDELRRSFNEGRLLSGRFELQVKRVLEAEVKKLPEIYFSRMAKAFLAAEVFICSGAALLNFALLQNEDGSMVIQGANPFEGSLAQRQFLMQTTFWSAVVLPALWVNSHRFTLGVRNSELSHLFDVAAKAGIQFKDGVSKTLQSYSTPIVETVRGWFAGGGQDPAQYQPLLGGPPGGV